VLALAGVLMPGLLRNALADPYVLGISGGAAVGALGVMLAGLAGLAVNAGAAAGAFAAMLLVFAVAHGPGGWTTTRLLLTGVVVAAGCGAIVSLLLSLSDDLRLRGMLFWLLGDFGYVRTPWSLLALALFAIPACLLAARPLDVLARGELQARLLGVPVRGLRIGIYVAASVLTAAAVLRRPGDAPPGATHRRLRSPRSDSRGRARRRYAAGRRRPAGADHRRTAAAAGRRTDRAARRSAVPAADAPPAGGLKPAGFGLQPCRAAARSCR
jgi:hypothetical protein